MLDTSRLLIESYDPDFVLNNLLLITMGKLLTPKGAILLRHDPKSLYVAKAKGMRGIKEKEHIPCAENECKTDVPIISVNEFDADKTSLFRENGLDIFFNIKTSSRHLGYLCIGQKAGGRPYSEDELGFIENLVIISAVAISNSMLISELKDANRDLDRKVQELNTLFDISREFNTMVDRSQMLNVFRFALMGQMFVRKFFFLMMMENEPHMMIQQGVKGTMGQQQKLQLMEMDQEYIEISDMNSPPDYLLENDIRALIRLNFQNENAILGIGPRANDIPYTRSDYNFLMSLGSLAFLSIQKTFLLESRIEKEKLEEELSLARTIQNALFPNPMPVPQGYEIAAINVPSRQVGGDYYDVIKSGDNELILAIADVTGKGIPASLLMANLQSMLHVLGALHLEIGEVTGKVNDIIFKNTPSDKFISFFWGILDLSDNTFHYCNAGHNPPVFVNGITGETSLLTEGGMLLGALPTMMPYTAGKVKMHSGDLILMFTDGVSESMDEYEEEYGEERIATIAHKAQKKSASEILTILLDDVKQFCNNQYGDDLTVLIIKAKEE